MRKMLTIATALGSLALAGTVLSLNIPHSTFAAQSKPAPPAEQGRGGGRMAMMAEALGLTDAQKAKLAPIMKSQMQQMRALRDNTTMKPQDKMAQMRAIHDASRAQMMQILTPAQRQKLEEMRRSYGGPGGPQH